jgi:hypothetical protein
MYRQSKGQQRYDSILINLSSSINHAQNKMKTFKEGLYGVLLALGIVSITLTILLFVL